MRLRSGVVAAMGACALVAGMLVPAAADDLDHQKQQVDAQVRQASTELEVLSRQLRSAATALQATREQLPAARAALADVQSRLATSRDQLMVIRSRLQELHADQAVVKTQIRAARERIAVTEDQMGQIVRFEYQSSGLMQLQLVLAAEDASDFLQKLATTQQFLDQQSDVVDQLVADKAVLAAQEQQLQVTEVAIEDAKSEVLDTVSRLKELAADARDAKQRLEELMQTRSQALAVARDAKAVELAKLKRLKAQQAALADQIRNSTSSGSGHPDGQLLWPAPGPMVQGVGWRVHPVYYYRSCHTGIDISASQGTPIRAAAAGTVVWTSADLSGPYGNNTLIDHGDGLSTFYAHQVSFAVSPGQHVAAGQVIGYVGATGYATGPHLHFEVHINGVPYDPMGWFGGTKTPQSQFCP